VTSRRFAFIASACCLALAASATGAAATVALEYRVEKVVRSTAADGTESVDRAPAEAVAAGDELIYTIGFTNEGGETVEARGVVVTNPLPAELEYVAGSASGADTEVAFSSDGGLTFAVSDEPASACTTIRWTYLAELPPGATGEVSFHARVK
jgi:uncharacterized repeat protein (TIGR01451 family)